MVTMQLIKNEEAFKLGVLEQEATRLVLALQAGETLSYQNEDEHITLQDGVLTLAGFQTVPELFAPVNADGSARYGATYPLPLKSFVKKVIVEEGVEELVTTFRKFENLTEIRLPSTLVRIYNAFEECNKLKFPALPAGLRVFHTGLSWVYTSQIQKFTHWPKDIILPEGMEDIGQTFAFAPIHSIVIPASMQVIPSHAFYRCKQLSQVTLSEGVKEIVKEAFGGCDALETITLPASLAEIDSYAFCDCKALTNVVFAGDPVIYGNAFLRCPCEGDILLRSFNQTDTIPYTADMDTPVHMEQMLKVLAGKTLLEQAAHFSVSCDVNITSYAYGEEEGSSCRQSGEPLAKCKQVEKLILQDGVIVGVVIDGVYVTEGETFCTYSASEDDGSGSRSREDYATLIFQAEV